MGTERGGDLKAPKDGDCDALIIGDLAGVKPGGNDDGDAITELPCLPRRGPASVKEVCRGSILQQCGFFLSWPANITGQNYLQG